MLESANVSGILQAVNAGETGAEGRLIEVVYEELRRMAQANVAKEQKDQSLNATALVHEAWIRLLGNDAEKQWNSRGHFFAAAAQTMRRILIDRARHRNRLKRGEGKKAVVLDDIHPDSIAESDERLDLLELEQALLTLEAEDAELATLVNLRFFTGFTIEQTADAMNLSVRTANRRWAYAKARLHQFLNG